MLNGLRYGLIGAALVFQLAAQDPAAGVHRFTLGRMTITCLQDGEFQLPANLLGGIAPAEAAAMLGGREKIPTPVSAFLVKTQGKLVLVDTGAGKGMGAGRLPEDLKAAAVDPAQVDLIFITHMHLDHMGGLLDASGARAFPNAVLRVAKAESDYWLGDPAKLPERSRGNGPKLKAIVDVYRAAGAFRPFVPGEDLGSGIRALPTAGHTPGHTCYAFASEGKELWCLGDLIHFGAVQFTRPTAAVSFDTDSPRAIAARVDLFKAAARAHAVVAGAHLAFPGVFQLTPAGEGYTATPFVN